MRDEHLTRRSFVPAVLLLATLWATPAVVAQEEETTEATPPPLTLEAIEVTPAKPAVDTLCRLKVRLRNTGKRPISGMAFTVTVAGHPLSVYKNQLFYQLLPAGETSEVALFNFWTTETGRPAPKDGKLPVEVSLTEATWIDLSTDEDGVEVWKIQEAIPGLPIGKTLPLVLAKPKPVQEDKPSSSSADEG